MKQVVIISILMTWVLSGCFTEEEPILPIPPYEEDIELNRAENGQAYYSLQDRKIIKSNAVDDWDLAFSCAENDYTILLNSARGMGAHNTNNRDFEISYPAGDYPWIFDECHGQEDQSCLGKWGDFSFDNPQSYGFVYLINRGVDFRGLPTSIYKLKIQSFEKNSYNIRIGSLDGSYQREYRIDKNDSFNYVYLSFDREEVLHLEPHKDSWDLLFTPYTTNETSSFSPMFFTVTSRDFISDGILLNPYGREAASDTLSEFESIDFFDVDQYVYTDTLSRIGNVWYRWNDPVSAFTITPYNTFVVRDHNLKYYAIQLESFGKKHTTWSRVKFRFKSL